jgi:hypothetical protein
MIYFGDGETDIPCMQLIKQQGGHSIAVYNSENTQKKATAEKLITEDRVNFVCAADYGKDSELYRVVTTVIAKMKTDAEFDRFQKKNTFT